jgi:hypothetical protein
MKKEFDYYIYIDYSENLIGYIILDKDNFKKILLKISRFRHYRDARDKRLYLRNIKNTAKRERLFSYFTKIKIKNMRQNLEIYSDVLDFLKKHERCLILVSVDNHEFSNFKKLVEIVDGEKIEVLKESELKVNTPEYQVSLVLDNLLNIERLKDEKK